MQAQPIATGRAAQTAPRVGQPGDVRLIGVTKTFARDQEIFGEGDRADFVYRVLSGAVRAYRVLADGRRQISAFHLPGDVFGLEPGADHETSAEAIGETVLIVARRSAVIDDPDLSTGLWGQALGELRRSQAHMMTLGRRTAIERVATFLADLAKRLSGGFEFDLAMSRQDIADYLGVTIETVSRVLTQLQTEGLIELAGCRHVRLARPIALAQLCQ